MNKSFILLSWGHLIYYNIPKSYGQWLPEGKRVKEGKYTVIEGARPQVMSAQQSAQMH